MTEYKQAKLEDSNIANIGSVDDIELRVKAARSEKEWIGAGQKEGIEVWQVEKFNVKRWPLDKFGKFYDGDSYIVLRTFKKSDKLLYDVHFWLGKYSSQDEKGVAAYKTVELDDLLGSLPVQHREVQDYESDLFLSYFNPMIIMHGGIESGFRHIENKHVTILYHIKGRNRQIVRQVEKSYKSLNSGDSFVLDAGSKIFIWNGSKSGRTEQFKASQIANSLKNERGGSAEIIRLDENGNEEFWKELGGRGPIKSQEEGGCDLLVQKNAVHKMYRLSDATGTMKFDMIAEGVLVQQMLDSHDVFIIDGGNEIFVWIGNLASVDERKYAMKYAMTYMQQYNRPNFIPITRILENQEPDNFWNVVLKKPLSMVLKERVGTVQSQSQTTKPKTLMITVLQGRNLASKDWTGKSDPWVKIFFKPALGKTLKTRWKRATLNPVWNESFTVMIPPDRLQWTLIMEVWDFDYLKKGDFMGRIELTPNDLSFEPKWITLQTNEKKEKVSGEIQIQMAYLQ